METFHEMYFDGAVDFKGDALDVMEYRHDWANFKFTFSLFRFFLTGMIPEVIMHTRSQGTCTDSLHFLLHSLTKHPVQTKNKSVIITTAVTTSTAGSLVHA